MARRKIFWHIGPDDVGTAWIADALHSAREDLAAAGVQVPGTPAQWELITAELRRTHRELGLCRGEVEGSSARLARELWRHRGTTVLSLPGLAAATPEQVALALDGVRGAELHLVVVQRDLTTQLWAGARAALEQGATTRPHRFVERVLGDDESQAVRGYRAGHDLPRILARWSRTVLPEHVHVVAESSPELVWKRLVGLLGADVPLPSAVTTPVVDDLGAGQLDVLRDVAVALDDRLDARGRREVLRDWVSRDLLARQPAGAMDALPEDVTARLRTTAVAWTAHLRDEEYDVQGTLRADRDETDAPAPTTQEYAATALAEVLVEVDRLRVANADLLQRNEHLDKKRRKHKSRAKKLAEKAGPGSS